MDTNLNYYICNLVLILIHQTLNFILHSREDVSMAAATYTNHHMIDRGQRSVITRFFSVSYSLSLG